MGNHQAAPYPNEGEASVEFPVYTRGNMGEAFPNVITPMSGSLMLAASARSQTKWFLETGALSKRQIEDPKNQMFVQFGGYLYANVSMARIAAVRAPGLSVDDFDAQYGGVGVLPPYQRRTGDRSLAATLRLGRFAVRAFGDGDAKRAEMARKDVDDWVASLPAVESADDPALLERVRQASRWFEQMLPEMMTVTLHAGTSRVLIERLSAATGEPSAANAITSGLGGVASAGPPIALWELGRQVRASSALTRHFDRGTEALGETLRSDPECADFVAAFDVFLEQFGFHGADELELSSPKWGTDPELALRIVERLRLAPDDRDPTAAAQRLATDRAHATRRVRGRLGRTSRALFDRAVRATLVYAPARETTKAALVRALFESRRALNELARRHGIAQEDVYLLLEDELEAALAGPADFRSAVERRRTVYQSLQEREPPFWFAHHLPDPSTWPLRAGALDSIDGVRGIGASLQGLGVSGGTATGRARVILDPNEPFDLEPDEILVAPQTDPAWTPLFLGAAGVIVEYGAVMSHAAIVARELGIPAVVGIDRATTVIATGAVITIDGTTGVVTIDEPQAADS